MDRFHAFTRAIDRYLPTFTDGAHAYKEGLLGRVLLYKSENGGREEKEDNLQLSHTHPLHHSLCPSNGNRE